jgi:hypothetical protein
MIINLPNLVIPTGLEKFLKGKFSCLTLLNFPNIYELFILIYRNLGDIFIETDETN